MRRYRFLLAAVVITASLGGCAQLPTKLDRAASLQSRHDPTWLAHEHTVKRFIDWQCIGRIAIRTETRGGTVNLNWRQDGETSTVVLNAPLNQGTVELIGRPDRMLITDSSGQRELTTHPEKSIEAITGWRIPIAALPDWIRGLPHDGSAFIELNENGLLHRMSDDGWTIDYESYRPVPGHNLTMPRLISVSNGSIHLRLVIESWQMHSGDTSVQSQ